MAKVDWSTFVGPPSAAQLVPAVKPGRKRRVEINGRMQSLFRRMGSEDGDITAEIQRVIREEAEKLMWTMASKLTAIDGIRTGELLSSLDVDIGGKGLSAEVGAGAGMKDRQEKQWMNTLALWLEFGTRPHALGEGSSLRVGKKAAKAGKKAIQQGRLHPGQRPRPWVRPAYEIRRPTIVKRLEEAAVKALKQFGETTPPNMKP